MIVVKQHCCRKWYGIAHYPGQIFVVAKQLENLYDNGMCGIAGYIGKKEPLPIVLANLRKLEYRGYDSAGVAFFNSKGEAEVIRAVGQMTNLGQRIADVRSLPLTAAIGHTRWATHGVPSEANAHPHSDCNGSIFVVHNGIIENYQRLKTELIKKGHRFRSETDTEVVPHLMEEYGFDGALKRITGAYAIAAVFKNEPQKIHVAKLGSPMVIGVGKDEYYLASDPTALAGLVKKVIYIKEGQKGFLSLGKISIGPARPKIERLNLDAERAQKGNFPHFMLKEIFEGPAVLEAALRGRLRTNQGIVKLGGLESVADKIARTKKLDILACGTSYYSGLIGELLFEEIADLPTEVSLASEYRYRDIPIRKGTAALFISQSGETADTLAALRKAKHQKLLTLGVVNAVGSSIARETSAGVYNHAGPEIGVASTKAFISQLGVLSLMALYMNRNKKRRSDREIMKALAAVPRQIRLILKQAPKIKALAKKYIKNNNFLYLGRGYNYPTALEGALKLKEISYVHAEGYSGGEMKHGPIALIDKDFPTIAIVTKNKVYEKMVSNLQEIKARSGPIIAIASDGDKEIKDLADDVVYVPKTLEPLEPLLNVIPLQLFAYYFAVAKGYDVDKPRNLAKSVTVE